MRFITMDPILARKAIEGYENVLQPALAADEAFYRQFKCPRCKSDCQKEFLASHAFTDEELLPRAILRCRSCRHLFDPHTGITLELGNPAQVPPDIHLIGG